MSTPQALVTSEPRGRRNLLIGCLRASGVERRLATGARYSEHSSTTYGPAAVAGAYTAVVTDQEDPKGEIGQESVQVFNLRTGAPAGDGGESVTSGCSGPICQQIDSVAVGTSGVSAAETQGVPKADKLQLLCRSASLCMATDSFGQLLTSTSPARGPWSPASGLSIGAPFLGAGNGGAAGGACPSASLCVIVQGSAIYTSTDPAAGVWSAASPAAGTGSASPQFYAVSCPSKTLCVAITGNGQVAVSTDPAGGASAWTLEDIDGTAPLAGVACPTSSECLISDLQGNLFTATDPAGGASAWTAVKMPTSLWQFTCPAASLCVGRTGNAQVAVSTHPTSGKWTLTKQSDVQSVTCPSASLCLAVDGGKVSYTTAPASGRWTSYNVSQAAGSLSSIACPTTTLCIASEGGSIGNGGDGNVLESTNPTAPAARWSAVLADQVNCTAAPSACETGQIISSDSSGVHVADTETEYGSQGLNDIAIRGDILTWNHNGSLRSSTLVP